MKTLKEYITEQNFTDKKLYVHIRYCLFDFFETNDDDENYLLLAIDEYNSVYKALTEKDLKYDADYVWKTIIENYEHLIEETINKQQFLQIVKKYDRDTGRIELSYKELLGTFEENVKEFKEGDIVEGVVRNRIKTGVFVELKPNVIGIAEHVNGIEPGQKVLVSIRKINLERKKIKLIIIG